MDELKDAVNHADDLLDEIATNARRCKLLEAQARCHPVGGDASSQVIYSLIFTTAFDDDQIESRIKDMTDQLEVFAKRKDVLGLTNGRDAAKMSSGIPSTSLVDESSVYGRDPDKEKIIGLLLSNDDNNNKVGVIPIVGMGGIGKTTLTKLVYNDERVNQYFDTKAWVCVSNVFHVSVITKTILEAVTKSKDSSNDLNQLKEKLRDSLSGKRFLIVLDDVYGNWDALRAPFVAGKQGSRIIVTTRNRRVAGIMQTVAPFNLGLLSVADCWSLMAKHAFGNGDCRAYPELEKIDNQIAIRRCKGLPLAAKTLGGLLRSKCDPKVWNDILEHELWKLPEDENDILPALRLSYHYLPSHLKQCFAYCSLFPKDYKLRKEELVYSWMAQNFVQQSKTNKAVEEVAKEYIDEFLSRSLLQQSSDDEGCFEMHDLIHDLAEVVAGQFCFKFIGNKVDNVSYKVRYFSFVTKEDSAGHNEALEAILGAKNSRAVLHLDSYFSTMKIDSLDDMFNKLRHVRELRLPSLQINEIPDSIGNLMHLRYLNLFDNPRIKQLPESICNLCNLQTLILSKCTDFCTLPMGIDSLIDLRYLDINDTNLTEMPMGISELKHLCYLTDFVVGKDNGPIINVLKEFRDLYDSLHISNLQNVGASKTDLMRDKEHLEYLELTWDGKTKINDFRTTREVLFNLQPHTNLERLQIVGYEGTSFPAWLGNSSYSKMTSITLENCKNCFSLPSLGQLPSLKVLTIKKMPEITELSPGLYQLPHLERISIEGCSRLVSFAGKAFPSVLTYLSIDNCECLESLGVGGPPRSLKFLQIGRCPVLQFPNLICDDDNDAAATWPLNTCKYGTAVNLFLDPYL